MLAAPSTACTARVSDGPESQLHDFFLFFYVRNLAAAVDCRRRSATRRKAGRCD